MSARTLKWIAAIASLAALSCGGALADTIELNGLPCNEICQWWMGVAPVNQAPRDLRPAHPENQPLAEAAPSRKKLAATQVKKRRPAHRVAEKPLDRRLAGKLPLAPPAPTAETPIDAGPAERAPAPAIDANSPATAEINSPRATSLDALPPIAPPEVQTSINTEPPAAPAPEGAQSAPAQPSPEPIAPPVVQAPKITQQSPVAEPDSVPAPPPEVTPAPLASAEAQASIAPLAPEPDGAQTAPPLSSTAPPAPTDEIARATTDGKEDATAASADPPPSSSEGKVLILLARPEIKLITDVGDDTVILAGSFSVSKARIATTLSAAASRTVTVVEGSKNDVGHLIDGDVHVVVAALLSPEAAKAYPGLEGLSVIRVPLSPP